MSIYEESNNFTPVPVPEPTLLDRIGMAMRDPVIRATMSNVGANMVGQPGASPRVDAFHGLNKIVQGTGLGQTMNQATVGAPKPKPIFSAKPNLQPGVTLDALTRKPTNVEQTIQEDHPNYKAAKSGINSMVDILYNTPPPAQALQNPPQASTEPVSATPVDATAPVAPSVMPERAPAPVAPTTMPETGGIPMSTITNLLATGSQPTRADMFEGYTPDPMMIGNIVAGLGTDAAMKPYEMMLNTEKARAAEGAKRVEVQKAVADMLYKNAQIEDLRAKRDPRLAGVTKRYETEGEMAGKEASEERKLVAYGATPQGSRVIDPAITKALGLRKDSTYYDYAREVGIANVHTLYERYVSNLNAKVASGGAVTAAERSALIAANAVLSTNDRIASKEYSDAVLDYKAGIMANTDPNHPENVARAAEVSRLKDRSDYATAQFAASSNALQGVAKIPSAGTKKREAVKAKAEEATIPKIISSEIKAKYPDATNIRKVGSEYLFESGGQTIKAK
jgi:hypothetical protein